MTTIDQDTITTIRQVETKGGHFQVAEDLHLFRVPKHRFRHGQSYGLIREGRTILIDAVHTITRPAVDKLLAQYPAAALLLTHSDLVAQAFGKPEVLSTWLGGAPVLIHSMDSGNLDGLHPLESNGPQLENLGIEFFHVPGHTPGSSAYLDRKEGYLFTGDIIVGNNYEKDIQHFTHAPIADADWPANEKGWQSIPAERVQGVFPLHGQPSFGDGAFTSAMRAGLDRGNIMTP